jgi:hypothetical protein
MGVVIYARMSEIVDDSAMGSKFIRVISITCSSPLDHLKTKWISLYPLLRHFPNENSPLKAFVSVDVCELFEYLPM